MQKITPHLWFDKEAKEAAEFYVATFGNESKLNTVTTLHNTPSGDADMVSFTIADQPFMAISAGPIFKPNPSISFHFNCASKEEVDEIWKKLQPGGKVMMELGSYPFSERFGWIEDKYGVSWQVIYTKDAPLQQRVTPVLMFTKSVVGRAEEAITFYTSAFKNAKGEVLSRYNKGEDPEKEGNVRYGQFTISDQTFGIMESARDHAFSFTEGISLMIFCENQEEIDYYWEKLSADPTSEQCGWLKDKYGVSWQVTPSAMGDMLQKGTPEQIERVTQSFLSMKKFDIATLQKAFDGK